MTRAERQRRNRVIISYRSKQGNWVCWGQNRKTKEAPGRWKKAHPSFTYNKSLKWLKKDFNGKERARTRQALHKNEGPVYAAKGSVRYDYW